MDLHWLIILIHLLVMPICIKHMLDTRRKQRANTMEGRTDAVSSSQLQKLQSQMAEEMERNQKLKTEFQSLSKPPPSKDAQNIQ